ncbi:MAG: glycoside hydrolase family 76 [Thermoleophilia bacterium]|nr:glycoside hydrolase family 76 [Thermoleophilia bacterium]
MPDLGIPTHTHVPTTLDRLIRGNGSMGADAGVSAAAAPSGPTAPGAVRTAATAPPVGFQGSDAQRARMRDAAMADYRAIQSQLVVDGGDALKLREHSGAGLGDILGATAWPHGQVAAAALDRALISGDTTEARKALAGLDRFEQGDTGSYKPTALPWNQDRFYDDNAWIGLDFVQAARMTGDDGYVDKARKVFTFLEEGLHKDGGLYWKEGEQRMSRNAASTGPAMQLALQLHDLTGEQHYLDVAKNLEAAETKLLRDDRGLILDNVGDDGSVESSVWSYNQGTYVGGELQLFEQTGNRAFLQKATSTATAALDHFAKDDGLWKQPPAFNAVFFRNLLQLDAVAPDPRIRATLERYLERARDSRDGNGLYSAAQGMGQYEGHDGATSTIDQAAFVQMHALLAMTPEQLATVT